MRSIVAALLAASAVLVFSASAFAQGDDVDREFYEFPDGIIEGGLPSHAEVLVQYHRVGDFETLLNIDRSFMEEIQESAGDGCLE